MKFQSAEFKEELVAQCLDTIKQGTTKSLYNILPQISILHDPRLMPPLIGLLRKSERPNREFAALALGTMQSEQALKPLYVAFINRENLVGTGSQALQTALLVAIGGIGGDKAVDYLAKLYDYTFKGDRFFRKRRQLVLSSLGEIAQQNNRRAEAILVGFLSDKDAVVRAQAVVELSTAYWQRPNELSAEVIQRLLRLTRDPKSLVKEAAVSSLMNLADLGSKPCEELFRPSA